jgi:hypothetical protein
MWITLVRADVCARCGGIIQTEHHLALAMTMTPRHRCQPRLVQPLAMGFKADPDAKPVVVPMQTSDPVNPAHYKGDLVMRIIEHFGLVENFYLGNVVKYILRHKNKAGIEDLKKAAWYLTRAIESLEGKHVDGVK